ncbi:MAG TPA: DUF2380 domain-containing protein [Methylocella sp.]|nr:DUF2380 domain-containing protein [Methylocella sp.]
MKKRSEAVLGALPPACASPEQTGGKKFSTLLRALLNAACALALVAAPFQTAAAKEDTTPAAVADFDYQDTSGEPDDQRAAHERRLAALMSAMRDGLAASGKFRIVSFTCEPAPCSLAHTPPEEILKAARRAGARLLVFGGIHKMSTLIQWAKLQAVDLQTSTPVLDRLLTFRGDTDEAWRRAGAYMVEQVKALALSD